MISVWVQRIWIFNFGYVDLDVQLLVFAFRFSSLPPCTIFLDWVNVWKGFSLVLDTRLGQNALGRPAVPVSPSLPSDLQQNQFYVVKKFSEILLW